MTPPMLVLCRDLLFTSKITGTAKAREIPVKVLRDPNKLADEPSPRLVVDLTQEGFLDAAVEWKKRTGGHVTGFAGHTDVELINAAQAAGVDLVLSRGEFSARLNQVLDASTPR
jgi:hypothetical protein